MGKNDFIKKLNKHLKDIPDEERQDIIRDFDEHFWMAEEEGKNEQQIANDLGDPKALAKSLRANFFINQAKTNTSWNDMRNALAASIGLSVFNFIFILSPFLLIITIILSLIVVGPLTMILSFALFFQIEFMQALFNGLIFFGCGLFLFVSGIYLAKNFYRLFIKYLEWNKKVIRGQEQ